MASAGDAAVPPSPLAVATVPLGVEIPPEPPEVGARALHLAARMLAGATTFFFLAYVFAYFYLRSLNVQGQWHPTWVKPNEPLGAAIIVCVLVSAGLSYWSARQMRQGNRGWVTTAGVALTLGLLVVVLQIIEWAVQGFGPTNGAYASVFIAWTSLYVLAVLGALYWLETQVATELRARRSPAARGVGDISNPDRLIAPGLDAAAFYWAYLAAVGAITYVLLYLIQ